MAEISAGVELDRTARSVPEGVALMGTTVARVLQSRVAQQPDRELIKCGGPWLTAHEVDRISAAVAAGLHGLGLGKGDRVAVMMPNRQEMIEVFFACARSGLVQVPVNIFLKGEFLRYQLADCQARVAIVDRDALAQVLPLIGSTSIEYIVVVDPIQGEQLPSDRAVVPYSHVRACLDPAPTVELRDEDLVSILYTSGTTGPSKGCMLSNAYYTVPPQVFMAYGWLEDDDRIVTPFQLFHGAAHAVLMKGITAERGSVCFETSFSASRFIERAREESATLLWLLPAMTSAILARDCSVQAPSDPSFRVVVCPGLPERDQLEFERRFGGRVAAEMYGQTESLGVTLGSLAEQRRPGTAGRPGPHVEVQLVDEHDRAVPVGVTGEIVVRPRIPFCIYSGYWNNAEATVSATRNLWHHTGDLAVCDDDGVLSFVDRKKDSLRRRGENVSSFELEETISRFPKVGQVAVCAVDSPLGEDDIKAVIVLKPGTACEPQELFEFFKAELPYFAIPRFVDIRDSLPVTAATGRVQKYVLREEGITESMWDFDRLSLSVDRSQRR